MSTDAAGGYMMSNCGSVYSISAEEGVCVKPCANISVCIHVCVRGYSMYDRKGLPPAKASCWPPG